MKKNLLFFVAIAVLSVLYYYPHVVLQRPMSFHQWRQCDALMLTHNYFISPNFFEPKINQLMGDGGKMVGEFPIYYFCAALLYKVFGVHEMILRLLCLFTYYLGIFYFFKLCSEFFEHWFYPLIISLFWFALPLVVYYGNNFLMDVPAVSFSIMGLWFYYQYFKNDFQKTNNLFYAAFFFSLSALLKITALIPFGVLIGLAILQQLKFLKTQNFFKNNFHFFILIFIPVVCFSSWYSFANYYNAAHNNTYFLLKTKPIWHVDKDFILTIFKRIHHEWMTVYMNHLSFILLALLFVFLMIKIRAKKFSILKYSLVMLVVAVFSDFALFFEQFYHHDYYAVVLLILVPAILFATLFFLKNEYPKIFQSPILKIGFAIFFLANVYHTNRVMHHRYFEEGSKSIYNAYFFIEPTLDKIGCKKDDLVISVGDRSTGISLYLMNRIGYNVSVESANDTALLLRYKKSGAKFLIENSDAKMDSNTIAALHALPNIKNRYTHIF